MGAVRFNYKRIGLKYLVMHHFFSLRRETFVLCYANFTVVMRQKSRALRMYEYELFN